ncbi:phospholipid phosphatase 1-like [Mercenaria mercenaria]|uniref:phospholipid phosphatase 1-like n=1 Tax=Mercenaria mercenaria TaxID=6596 RepID=UPI00234E39BF|nr:phospholipid phosphatase 1-like [Mercenaria mercenaria]
METISNSSKRWRSWITFQLFVDVVVWLCAAFPVLYLFLFGTPYDRGFFCDDVTLSYPYKPDTVSASQLVLGGFAISVFVVVIVEVLRCVDCKSKTSCQVKEDISYCMKGYAVFLVGFVIEQFVVQVLKMQMGVLRPNFFDVCKPDFNRTFCPGYITNYTCAGDEDQVRDSRQSFPSGHASFSMYVAIFFCIYVQNRLEIDFSYTLKFFLQTGLIFTSVLCGLTRIKDHMHHPTDVAAGFSLGFVIAVFVYNMVGKKVLNRKNSDTYLKNILLMTKSRNCCGSDMQTPQCHTPLPLLKNDFLNMGFEKTPTTPLLTDSPFNVRRPQSMPETSLNMSEEV